MDIKLLFGLHNGELVHISRVENGIACNCICPSCEKQLIARKGDINEHHFAHSDGKECNVAFETALQVIGKNILEKHKRIVLPALYFEDTNKLIYPETEFQFNKITFEKQVGSAVPVIFLYRDDRPLMIQIGITPFIDWFTRIDGRSAIKINVSGLFNSIFHIGIGDDHFEKQLIERTDIKRWMHNIKHDQIKKKVERIETTKPIVHSGLDAYPMIIENCPINKKAWKSGYKIGQTYACVFDDCSRCSFGRIIKATKNFNNENVEMGRILSVQCCGDRQNDIDSIINDSTKEYYGVNS